MSMAHYIPGITANRKSLTRVTSLSMPLTILLRFGNSLCLKVNKILHCISQKPKVYSQPNKH